MASKLIKFFLGKSEKIVSVCREGSYRAEDVDAMVKFSSMLWA
jgi:hypothetical protein